MTATQITRDGRQREKHSSWIYGYVQVHLQIACLYTRYHESWPVEYARANGPWGISELLTSVRPWF